jgi:enamine deaminase RidA (YjgF/YER057c/UK114 family)
MGKRIVDQHQSFTIYTTFINKNQIYISAPVTDKDADSILTYAEIYKRILDILAQEKMQIVHERLLGSTSVYADILKTRRDVLMEKEIDSDQPITYIQGKPYWGEGFAGIQIRAVTPREPGDKVWTIYDNDIPCGRGWNRNGAQFLMLHSVHGLQQGEEHTNSRKEQASRMFEKAERLLKSQGSSYRNVVRTWIYFPDILDWYGEFNEVRNAKYKEFGFIPGQSADIETEQIYLPASTGIQGGNPLNAAVVMDVLAVIPEKDTRIQVEQTSGVQQKSPFRYGSAFSRAMSIREPNNTLIFVSGTASIDEKGKSVHIGDTRSQIFKTVRVVEALIAKEGASLDDICTATVFLKRPEDISIYQKTAAECGLNDMPAVCVIADVCRDELLFELDATVAL